MSDKSTTRLLHLKNILSEEKQKRTCLSPTLRRSYHGCEMLQTHKEMELSCKHASQSCVVKVSIEKKEG